MACLALALQPSNGPDILLQTREFFPPARALHALSAFRQTRLALSKHTHTTKPIKQSSSSTKPIEPEFELDPEFGVGDDPLAASSGQLLVGVESQYRVIYRLVNSVYVLAVTSSDAVNVFECINAVNQAVSIVVAACRGVDVTPEKLSKKYPEVYMALDIVLRGVGAARLSTILSTIHGDSIARMVQSAIDAENKARGADSWAGHAEALAADRAGNLNSLSSSFFELPQETLAAGDEFAATIAPPPSENNELPEEPAAKSEEEKDPFAASEKINKPIEETLVEGFKKTKDGGLAVSDPSAALAGLDVTNLPPPAETKPTHIEVEGFEGDYGGIEFGKEEASLSEAFEGFDNAFGGGLDASEFINTAKKTPKGPGLGGLELLATSAPPTAKKDGSTPLENLLVTKKHQMTGPEMYIAEEISAEFRESLLSRIGLKGTVYLRTLPPKQAEGKETEFSFRLEGTSGIKRVVMQNSCVSSLENGMFHVRTQSKEDPIPLIKYSLQPRFTPVPLRVRLVKRHSGSLLSVMIQYASNPMLSQPLTNVTFILKLTIDPTLLKASPKAVWNRPGREVKWHVPDIPLKGTAGKLRARMPVDQDATEEELEVFGMVKFASQGSFTLSGITLRPVSDGIAQLNEVSHTYASGTYICN